MRSILVLLLGVAFLFPSLGFGGGQMSPDEAIRMYRAQQMLRQMEEDFNNPKKVEVAKDRASVGPRSAPITLIEYSDFQCPYCKRGWEVVEGLKKKYGKKIFFTFKHLPLTSIHPMAMPAAKYFEAIARQSSAKAYEFHDKLFGAQEKLSSEGEKFLEETAKAVGANLKKLKKEMDSDTVKKRIDADQAEATSLGFQGTPAFVIAGVRVSGALPQEHFEQIIERRLKQQQK